MKVEMSWKPSTSKSMLLYIKLDDFPLEQYPIECQPEHIELIKYQIDTFDWNAETITDMINRISSATLDSVKEYLSSFRRVDKFTQNFFSQT